jgi:hypothetical protein
MLEYMIIPIEDLSKIYELGAQNWNLNAIDNGMYFFSRPASEEQILFRNFIHEKGLVNDFEKFVNCEDEKI